MPDEFPKEQRFTRPWHPLNYEQPISLIRENIENHSLLIGESNAIEMRKLSSKWEWWGRRW